MSDVFDDLLISSAQILEKGDVGEPDAYGVMDQDFTVLDTVRCRLSTKGIGRPKEFKAGKKSSLTYKTVFMRQWANGTLTEHHWLQINGDKYDILRVDPLFLADPSTAHHLEVLVELVKP
jgi:hypothetical protein